METDKPRRRNGCLWIALGVQAVGLLACILVIAGLAVARSAGGWAAGGGGRHGVDESPPLKEVWSRGSGDTKVVHLPLRGAIFLDAEEGLFGGSAGSAAALLKAIRRATHDSAVRGIVLDIDSGGGGITASDILYKALLDFKAADTNRKVVAVFGDVAASGAYYIAMAADHIVAHPTAITGSIGVLLQTLNIRELAQKVGIKDVTIKSGPNKDLLNPFEEVPEPQRKMLQDVIDQMFEQFVGRVASGRRMTKEAVRALADGQVFTAASALERGLIDQVGYLQDAQDRLAQLLGVPQVKVYRYEEEFSLSRLLRASQDWPGAAVEGALRAARPRLLYLWQL